MILSNSTVSGNSGGFGGGLHVEGTTSSISLSNSTVSGNTVVHPRFHQSRGAGIAVISSNLSMTDSTVAGNSGDFFGGGIYAGDPDSRYRHRSSVNLTNSTVSGNSGLHSGGIHGNYADITLSNCTVSGNSGSTGGGVRSDDYSNVNLSNSTVSGNSAIRGGGILANEDTDFILRNSTVSGNLADNDGGGIWVSFSRVSLTNSTVSDNSVLLDMGRGGGIYARTVSNISLNNSIVSGNSAYASAEIHNFTGSFITNGVNLLGDNSHTVVQAFSAYSAVIPGAGDITAFSDGTQPTPLSSILAPLDDNGGPTLTQALVADSPAINTADNSDCGPGTAIETDQRGRLREDGLCDIGAYEVSATEVLCEMPLGTIISDVVTEWRLGPKDTKLSDMIREAEDEWHDICL